MVVVHLNSRDSTKYFSCRPSANEAAQTPASAPLEPEISGGSQVEKSQQLWELLKVVDQLNQDGPVQQEPEKQNFKILNFRQAR